MPQFIQTERIALLGLKGIGLAVFGWMEEIGIASWPNLHVVTRLRLALKRLQSPVAPARATVGIDGLAHARYPNPCPRPSPCGYSRCRWTDHMIAALIREGTAFFTGPTRHGRRVMRSSEVNWRTGKVNVAKTLEAAAQMIAAERRTAAA